MTPLDTSESLLMDPSYISLPVSLPFDVVSVIIDSFFSVGDDGDLYVSQASKRALMAFSLACHNVLEPCRKAIFHTVHLLPNFKFGEKRPITSIPGILPEKLDLLVERHPHLARYVRRLRYANRESEDGVGDPVVMRLLRKFEGLEQLTIVPFVLYPDHEYLVSMHESTESTLHWLYSVPPQHRAILSDLMGLPSFKSLRLERITGFPLDVLASANPSLTKFSAKQSTVDPYPGHCPLHEQVALEYLALTRPLYMCPPFLEFTCTNTGSVFFHLFQSVKHLHVTLRRYGELGLIQNTLKVYKCLETLEVSCSAHIYEDHRSSITFYFHCEKIHASLFGSLKRLIIKHDGSIMGHGYRKENNNHNQLIHLTLLKAIPKLENLEELQLSIDVDRHLKVETYQELDELVAMLLEPQSKFPALERVDITISFYSTFSDYKHVRGRLLIREPIIFKEAYRREGGQLRRTLGDR